MATEFTQYPRQNWRDHMRSLKWHQGDHILLCAPTKAGKTTMMRQLIEKRSHSVIFVSKMKDPTFGSEFAGFERLTEWPKGGPKPYQKQILLWPKPEADVKDTLRKQRDIFRDAINRILHEGNRCVVIDESLMMNDRRLIGLDTEIGMMHYYGRSAGISMVDLTQRPAWIPRVILSSVTHAWVAKTTDADDANRLSDMGGIDKKVVGANLKMLPSRHDYLYLNPQGDASPVVVNTRK